MERSSRPSGRIRVAAVNQAKVLLVLPCNAAACVGDYFRAEVYRASEWNTWREADHLLRDLRVEGRVAFAAVDSSVLETAPADSRGAIVLETEMHRVRNPTGEDWGAPAWRWFRPTRRGEWRALRALTEALIRGVQRVEGLGIPSVLALVNPRAYFLALAAAVRHCGLLDRWVLLRVPAHPRHLLPAVRSIAPLVRDAEAGRAVPGGLYSLPSVLGAVRREARRYRDRVPPPWAWAARVGSRVDADRRWARLIARLRPTESAGGAA